jgi:hypothetical protein
MSGRRLADLLALASATRNIVKRHVDIQLQSASRAAVTSSITKAIKRDCRGPLVKTSSTRSESSKATSAGKEDVLLDGKDQDVSYDRSDSHSSNGNTGTDELEISQSQESIDIGAECPPREAKPTDTSSSTSSTPINPMQNRYIRRFSTHRSLPSKITGEANEKSNTHQNAEGNETKASAPNKEFEQYNISQETAQPSTPHDKLHAGINKEYNFDPEADLHDNPSKTKSVYPSRL